MTTTMPEVPGQLTIGEALRDEGIDQVEAHNLAWAGRAMTQLRALAEIFPHLTADDLRTRMAACQDEPLHHNAYGAVFRRASQAGWIEATDATMRSQRADAHARRLTVWRSLCLPW